MNHQETLTAYTSAFVDELSRVNIKHAVISPGSRSTPISMLLAKHPNIEVHVNLDERSAAFFALGLAKVTGEPVAIVCTSGTAAANYFPAIIEAHYSRIPLVVITADRPHELREVGAPQAIDQIHLYGKYVKWFCEMALPEMTSTSIQYVRNVSKRAAKVALSKPAGPVHLNLPLREPLVPIMDQDYFHVGRGERLEVQSSPISTSSIGDDFSTEIVNELTKYKKGIIICGEIHDDSFSEAVIELAEKLGYPILADPLSQLRTCSTQTQVIDCYDTFLRIEEVTQAFRPDVIIRFGSMPVSKALTLFVKSCKQTPHFIVDGSGGWREPTGLGTHMVDCDETTFCKQLSQKLNNLERNQWFEKWEQINTSTRAGLESIKLETNMSEGKIFAELNNLLPINTNLFVGNSMPIRDCDTFFHCNDTNSKVFANRGANGIDGIVSTALGVSAAGQPTLLVIGDVSFYHDLNGLLASKMQKRNLTIILVNNDGGGIFSFLPQSAEKEHFEDLFGTPHGLDFSHAVTMYGGQFTRVENWNHFADTLLNSFKTEGLKVIEVVTEREENVQKHRKLWKDVSQEIILSLNGINNENYEQ